MEGVTWILRQEQLPEPRVRVLVFSPAYPVNDPMRYRIMNGRSVKMCTEIEQWAYLDGPEVE